jgi:hypothetical protein
MAYEDLNNGSYRGKDGRSVDSGDGTDQFVGR